MSLHPRPGPQAILRAYFHAKDKNCPHLLESCFAEDAKLEVRNKSSAIAFPAVTVGREAIADALVRGFCQVHENVYSFYMARPPVDATSFSCDWLVCMTEKEGGAVKVGCGRYDRIFEAGQSCLASQLTITIEAMEVLPPSELQPMYAWIARLSYPWSSARAVIESAPPIDALAPVVRYLGRNPDI